MALMYNIRIWCPSYNTCDPWIKLPISARNQRPGSHDSYIELRNSFEGHILALACTVRLTSHNAPFKPVVPARRRLSLEIVPTAPH